MDAKAIDTLWVLLCTILVFFMQAGFALVEIGFTRAKDAGNIMMKTIVDFLAGSTIFWMFGYTVMFGADLGGFIGNADWAFSGVYGNSVPDKAMLMFYSVFAATAATIVSGAMAGRTKFSSYIIISIIITAVIYPIQGHWIWGGGWLAQLGFRDFAGSTVIHSMAGWASLIGATVIGPRLGKYTDGKVRVFPGHNIILGGLGVFIIWFGWFGLNAGAQNALSGVNAEKVAHIFLTTNLAAVAAGMATMAVSWIKYGKPDLSLTLNGILGGLVAVSAGCDIISPAGAFITGFLAGVILPFTVEYIDKTLKIDDPIGATSVHGVCGIFGTLAVGVFATEGGLLYGGSSSLLVAQLIGAITVCAWTVSVSYVLFKIVKATMGLRVSRQEETDGLDIHEHGQTAYN